jgi:hypothetical protein
MSIVTSPYTIPAAVKKADDIVGRDRIWNAVNDMQKSFLEIYEIVADEVAQIPEIESIASRSAEEINKFLAERGFPIKAPDFSKDKFGTAAVLKFLMDWKFPGTKGDIITQDKRTYPGVHMDGVLANKAQDHNNPVLELLTESSDKVYLTMLDVPPANEFEMISTARQLNSKLGTSKVVDLQFPMVDLDYKVELNWLPGLWTMSQEAQKVAIEKALRQTKLQMNHLGVKIEEAVAMVFETTVLIRRDLVVINRPFIMWVDRPDLSLPPFVGYITPDDWKDPGNLK